MDAEAVIYRQEAVGLMLGVADILEELRTVRKSSRRSMGRRKKPWRSREEREAWERHVDETIKRLRDLAEKGLRDLERKRATQEQAG